MGQTFPYLEMSGPLLIYHDNTAQNEEMSEISSLQEPYFCGKLEPALSVKDGRKNKADMEEKI
jgi:hypothetical protein